MKFGLNVSNLGSYWDVRNIVAIAKDAEQAGWDGVFVWDQMVGQQAWGNPPMCDPWIALGAVALATERVRIGPMITPIARRRPWKVARESVTVDRLSAGRMTLGVGLGNPPDDFAMFGEDANNHVRARKLDEGLDVLLGVWSGEEFSYDGEFFRLNKVRLRPRPVQRPRIPVWVAGQWPNRRAWRRSARYDGVYPVKNDGFDALSLAELGQVMDDVRTHRESADPFDVVLSAQPDKHGHRPGPSLGEYAEAGATWWITEIHDGLGTYDDMRTLVQAGPPKL
jgi:alkanesulfonate monooxygenase SsuD/methylene tetrahydromethanopterin reductase-like flavin-dependent oxidoreductase (luciferase family)